MAAIDIKDYEPQAVTVILDQNEDRVRKSFHCIVCCNTVFEYYGGIKIILFGHFNERTNKTESITDADGNEQTVDWFDKLGVPTPLRCSGKLHVKTPAGYKRVTCRTTYYKVS